MLLYNSIANNNNNKKKSKSFWKVGYFWKALCNGTLFTIEKIPSSRGLEHGTARSAGQLFTTELEALDNAWMKWQNSVDQDEPSHPDPHCFENNIIWFVVVKRVKDFNICQQACNSRVSLYPVFIMSLGDNTP